MYYFIRDLIQEGYAWFVNKEGRFAIKWSSAVERYVDYRANKNPNYDKNIERRKASNSLRSALLNFYKKEGAKEYEDCRKFSGKNEVIERQFQMPPRVFESLFGSNVELPDNRENDTNDFVSVEVI